MKKLGGVAILVLLLSVLGISGDKKVNKEIKDILKVCAKSPKCQSVVKDVKVMDNGLWKTEPILFIRATVPEIRIARYKGEDGAYIVLMIPDNTVEMDLVRFFEGQN